MRQLYHVEVPDTPTPRLWCSSGELNLRPQLWYHVRFSVTPKPANVDEHLKLSTRPYHQEWWLVHLFYIPRGVAVIPCGGFTDTPTPCLQRSSRELILRPMLWYHDKEKNGAIGFPFGRLLRVSVEILKAAISIYQRRFHSSSVDLKKISVFFGISVC